MHTCRYRLLLASCFVAVSLWPLVQTKWALIPPLPLIGVETPISKPTLSLESIASGEAARQFEAYFGRCIGFRGRVVRVVNQFHFTLFRRLTGSLRAPIVLGEDNWLYEGSYVRHYIGDAPLKERILTAFVARLKHLQDVLAARGIDFVLVVSPSKAEAYPEYLPYRFRESPTRAPANRNYTKLMPALKAADVHVLDVPLLFQQLKHTSEPLFPRTGTHWNYYGCFLVCRQILQDLKERQAFDGPLPQLDRVAMEPAIGTDRDLLRLLNLLWFEPGKPNLIPYPKVSVDAIPMDSRPNVLVVGDSFSFTLIDGLNLSKAVAEVELFYYFKRHFRYPVEDFPGYVQWYRRGLIGPLDRDAIDWERSMLSKDLVILEINETMFKDQGWGFVEAATKAAEGTF